LINQLADVKDLCAKQENVLTADDDIYNHLFLKPGKKEDQDFKVVD